MAKFLDIDGFRKGMVPADIAKKHITDAILLPEMAELALSEWYPKIAMEEKLEVIGRPSVSITKLARDNELGFTIVSAVVPELSLPDYKKIAKGVTKEDASKVEEKDIEKVIHDLREMRAYGHTHNHGEEGADPVDAAAAHGHTEELPEVNDEFAMSFGSFANVAEMKEKIKENLVKEKEMEASGKWRAQVMEQLADATTVELPDVLIESEQDKMLAQIEADIARAGFTLDQYLAETKKTRDEIKAEYKDEAIKRAKTELVLFTIAREEKLRPTEDEVKAQAATLVSMYPGADQARAEAYAEMVLTNEKVFALLEGSSR
jgi:FKBP-type peptidyl-prolyl cis-trans isomerase (trigger factor)